MQKHCPLLFHCRTAKRALLPCVDSSVLIPVSFWWQIWKKLLWNGVSDCCWPESVRCVLLMVDVTSCQSVWRWAYPGVPWRHQYQPWRKLSSVMLWLLGEWPRSSQRLRVSHAKCSTSCANISMQDSYKLSIEGWDICCVKKTMITVITRHRARTR